MKSILIFWFFLLVSISATEKLDYYWKNFDGNIPEDAFIGQLYNNIPIPEFADRIYVGQGYFKGAGVLPATIYPYLSTITVTERSNNPIISKNIKILCTHNPNALQWISVNYDDLKVIQNISFLKIIDGGTESDAPLYIGKHLHEGKMQIAKVYNVSPYEGLNVPNKSGGGTNFKDFEILVYCTIC